MFYWHLNIQCPYKIVQGPHFRLIVHTNCLISSSMLRAGLLAFWPKCQHRFLVITFLVNFCHTNCFISEFHFWFLGFFLTSLLNNKPASDRENWCYLVDKTTVSLWSVDFGHHHDTWSSRYQVSPTRTRTHTRSSDGVPNPDGSLTPQPCHFREEVMKPERPTPKNELVIDVILNNTWWFFRPVVVWNRIHPLW